VRPSRILSTAKLCFNIFLSLGFASFLWADEQTSKKDENFSFRVVANKVTFLEDCKENYSGERCSEYTFLTVSGKFFPAKWAIRSSPLFEKLPLPIWNRISSALVSSETSRCTDDKITILTQWINLIEAREEVTYIDVLPKEVSACLRLVDHHSRKLISHQFWIFQRRSVVATLTCSIIDAFPNPGCLLTAYAARGKYKIKLGHMPARMARELLMEAPQIIKILQASLPQNTPEEVKLFKLEGNGEVSSRTEKILLALESELK
jgi:hypothetical protein